jgi:hypothetical protein
MSNRCPLALAIVGGLIAMLAVFIIWIMSGEGIPDPSADGSGLSG